MKRLFIAFVAMTICAMGFAQTVTLTFTGRDAENHFLPLNRVVIGNLTQNWQETIYYPDTLLMMEGTGIEGHSSSESLMLSQNNPNPFDGTTYVTLAMQETGEVTLELSDISGRQLTSQKYGTLSPGVHRIVLTVAAPGTCLLTARQNGKSFSIKMVNRGNGPMNAIGYDGEMGIAPEIPLLKNGFKGVISNPYSIGDEMSYTGYAILNGTEYTSQTIHQNLTSSEDFVLNFDVTPPPVLATVTTHMVSDITVTTAISGGNVTTTGGAEVTARGICWSTSPNPTINDNHTSDGDGTGSFISNITGLTVNTTYYVRAYAVNSVGVSYGNELSFSTTAIGNDGLPCAGAATVTDYDGNTYNTIQIGDQCWMKENLRTTHYSNGDSIPAGTTHGTSPYRYCPNNDPNNVSTYGYLYNWAAVMNGASSGSANPSGIQGVCPMGWHVPSNAEFAQLTGYVGSHSEYVCGNDSTSIAKALVSSTGWDNVPYSCTACNNQEDNNATGFSLLPAGVYSTNVSVYGPYIGFGSYAFLWSATDYDPGYAYYCNISCSFEIANCYSSPKEYGFSVRCLRNDTDSATTSIPFVTTNVVTNITANSATCGGTVTDDGGLSVTARGVCWSTSPYPTVNDSYTTEGSGTGSFTSSMTGLTHDVMYYVRAYATNSMGTGYGDMMSFIIPNPDDSQPCPGAATMIDYDGNIYNTVQIGDQCWMKENLRTTHYANGDSIALGSGTSLTMAYRYYPNNNSANVSDYGYLYNWAALMHGTGSSSANPSGVQGICPAGWHVPSDAEWTQLEEYLHNFDQYRCGNNYLAIAKSLSDTESWHVSTYNCGPGYNPNANNATGFSARAAGDYYGSYDHFGYLAIFWSATATDNSRAFIRTIGYNMFFVEMYSDIMDSGGSVRCIRN